jgi:hypothetical protein
MTRVHADGRNNGADERFAQALGGKRFGGARTDATAVPAALPHNRRQPETPMPAKPGVMRRPPEPAMIPRAPERAAPPPNPNAVALGVDENGVALHIDLARLLEGRLLVQGISGAGKSWTLRRILEQTAARVQQLVIDPEGEFRHLADHLGHLHVEAAGLDPSAIAALAARAREHRLSLVLDLSELGRDGQMKAAAAFLDALVEAPREHWFPALVAIDEAHVLAPFGGQSAAAPAVRKAAVDALVDLMSRGRKRGLAGLAASSRLARLAKSVASEVQNFLIGMNTLDLDIRRAAETIGWDAAKGFDRLPLLPPGEFVAVGPAFSRSPAMATVGPVASKHQGAAPALGAPPPVTSDEARRRIDLTALAEESQARLVVHESRASPAYRAVRDFIREPRLALAARLYAALLPLAPAGAERGQVRAALGAAEEEIAGAIALLERFNAVETASHVDGRMLLRVSRSILAPASED